MRNEKIARILIENGADINQKDIHDRTSLIIVAGQGKQNEMPPETTERLLIVFHITHILFSRFGLAITELKLSF